MLELNSISRLYGDIKAVDNISFTVERGDVVGLLGHNGAGKTTVMKVISGFLEPDNGSIKLDGVEVTTQPVKLQRSLGYLPESPPVYPELTVAEYLDYAADLKGLSGENKHTSIKQAVEATELGSKLTATIATLSRGFKQRAGVAQAILGNPSLLILDEPTNGLDPAQTDQMRLLIRQLSNDATIILSTHIMQEVEAICDRALIIRRGKLAIDASLTDLAQSDQLLLDTNAELSKVKQLLADMRSISAVHKIATSTELSIRVHSPTELNAIAAEITRRMVHADLPVFGIRVNSRDLQSLFIDVNNNPDECTKQATEASHAA